MSFLPAILLAFGRRIFWPSIPRLDHVHARDQVGGRKLWGRVSGLVGRRPRQVWVVTALALLACAAFLPTFKASGISQEDLFLDKVESVTGQQELAKHFDAGAGTPVQILTPVAQADQVVADRVEGRRRRYGVRLGGTRRTAEGCRRQGSGPGHAEGRRPTHPRRPRWSSTCAPSWTRSARTSWSAATPRSTSTCWTPASATCG